MKLDALAKPLDRAYGPRFFVVALVPTTAVSLFLLVLVWAGAPDTVRFSRAWETAAKLGIGEIVLLVLATALAGTISMPLQLPLLRLLEGHWPTRPQWFARRAVHPVAQVGIAFQKWRRGLVNAAAPAGRPERQAAWVRLAWQRSRYPDQDYLLRPTAFGNALAAAERRAGRQYGLDAVVVWPRLEPLLAEPVRAAVADRRMWLDASARLSATSLLVAPVALVLLWQSGWWRLLCLAPVLVALLAYSAAVQAAVAYGECVAAAFDLHRFDLLTALHLPLPADRDAEYAQNRKLSTLLRQPVGRVWQMRYEHPTAPPAGPPPPGGSTP
ncbi:hypothetical protein OIB37_03715 [Streptomyces sp. NBC_00820]|uniref:hypothetical protein n=1 Tax=Streptomyces sp. NBC_00820 TaxID=2975842 RepID=UPI002ED48985|nr:hypothetical protein OIB37_03715 [Streptomyces sp. NBC_00820]